jgi:hypothetical protein
MKKTSGGEEKGCSTGRVMGPSLGRDGRLGGGIKPRWPGRASGGQIKGPWEK